MAYKAKEIASYCLLPYSCLGFYCSSLVFVVRKSEDAQHNVKINVASVQLFRGLL